MIHNNFDYYQRIENILLLTGNQKSATVPKQEVGPLEAVKCSQGQILFQLFYCHYILLVMIMYQTQTSTVNNNICGPVSALMTHRQTAYDTQIMRSFSKMTYTSLLCYTLWISLKIEQMTQKHSRQSHLHQSRYQGLMNRPARMNNDLYDNMTNYWNRA